MLITELELQNFRNYEKQKIEFGNNVNIFYGDNAQGKTNIIEAIFFMAFGKSFRTSKEKELIKYNEQFLNIDLKFKNKNRDEKIKIQIEKNKNIFINGVKIKKLSELLGKVNIVLFTPDDINILKNGPSQRRRFLDIMIGQIRPNYVFILNRYLKIIEERNNYLKKIRYEKIDYNLLDIYDEKIIEYSNKISIYRNEFIEKIKNKINNIHKKITQNKEEIKIEYISDSLEKSEIERKIKENRKIDLLKGYTTVGIQKDDFNIYINDKLVNIYGSQGQHRTAVLSLKISELEIIKDEIGENPILLLDDFMSELDAKRRTNFLNNIGDIQIIITCTDKLEIKNIKNELFYVNNGIINKIN